MIPTISQLLQRWGRYANLLKDGGVGYPKSSAFTNYMPRGDSYSSQDLDMAQDIRDIDQAIQRLETGDIHILICKYQRCLPDSDLWAAIGVGRRQYFRVIDRIHCELNKHLDDIEMKRFCRAIKK